MPRDNVTFDVFVKDKGDVHKKGKANETNEIFYSIVYCFCHSYRSLCAREKME